MIGWYENMAWSIAAAEKPCSVFRGAGFLLRPIDWAITKSDRLLDSLTVLLSRRTDGLAIWSSTRLSPKMVVIGHYVSLPGEQRAVYAI